MGWATALYAAGMQVSVMNLFIFRHSQDKAKLILSSDEYIMATVMHSRRHNHTVTPDSDKYKELAYNWVKVDHSAYQSAKRDRRLAVTVKERYLYITTCCGILAKDITDDECELIEIQYVCGLEQCIN